MYRNNFEIGKPFNPFNMFKGAYIPNGIMECPTISDRLKLLMGRLFQYSGRNGTAYPFRKTLAKKLGWDLRKLDRVIKEAKDKRLIKTTQETDNSPSEYIFLYSTIYDGKYNTDKSNGKNKKPADKNDSRGTDKNDKQRRESYKKRVSKDKSKDLSYESCDSIKFDSTKIKRKLVKIKKINKKQKQTKKNNFDKSSDKPFPKSKYKHNTTDLRNYNECKLVGATNHRSGTKAEIESLDKLHALFAGNCKIPYHVVHVPEKYIDYKWDMDELLDTFKFQLENAKKYNTKVIRSIGKFILSEGFNGSKSWSPLLHWHQKMLKIADGELTEHGNKLLSSMKRAKIDGIINLDSSIINKVAKDLFSVEDRFLFIDGNKRTMSYPFGIVDALSKYIKEKMNNLNFKLVYITKNGFVDEFLSEAQKRNIIKKTKKVRSLF